MNNFVHKFTSKFRRNTFQLLKRQGIFLASQPVKKAQFGIVVSLYNREYTDALLASAQKNLAGHGQTVVRVPGAFEIPLAVQRLAKTKKYHAILALGLVWDGQTAHASEIMRAVTDGLMRISLENNVPVIHAVLSVKTEAQARARCLGKTLNRGSEAAKTALFLAQGQKSK